jgi:hypothetical protein
MDVRIDPSAPPETVTITRAEYDQVKVDIANALDLHKVMRLATPIVLGDPITPEERDAVRELWQHYFGQHLGVI